MTKSDDDYPPRFWRDKADEARALTDNMVSKEGKHSMLQIASLYDGLADHAAARREEKRKRLSAQSN